MSKETCIILLISQETHSKIEPISANFLSKPKICQILYFLHRQDRMSKKPSVPLTLHNLSTYFYSCIAVIDSLPPLFLLSSAHILKAGNTVNMYSKSPLFLPLTQQKDLTSESSWLPREDDIYKTLHKVVARLKRNNAQQLSIQKIFDISGNCLPIARMQQSVSRIDYKQRLF